ncbi:beta-lactamase domain-containing protein [Fructilactobacillus fructivorans]|nr:beta-lactamase domain-containing protein [Fructilactobacillus fructivorans]KRN43261.1 beta-lactamase domain-containing protein [Fructilactobacillus fructivorans]
MIKMKLTVLGDYGGYPYNNIGTSGYLLTSDDFNLLIDCGSGVMLSLEQVIDPLKLNAVILSHYHADHIADVGVLQYYWQLHDQRYNTDVLPIYGNTADQIHYNQLDWPNSTEKEPFSADSEIEAGPFTMTFLKTIHPAPAFAIRIKERSTGKILSYTADTRYFDGLIDFVKDSDMLISDTNFFEDVDGELWHMTSKQSGRLARLSNSKNLLISHLPQHGSHLELLKQSQKAAGKDIHVELPEIRRTISI